MRRRRWGAAPAALAALAGFFVMTASAASLGGLSARRLGANSTMVVPCDSNGVAISYLNEFDFTTGTYRTVEVRLGDVAPPATASGSD